MVVDGVTYDYSPVTLTMPDRDVNVTMYYALGDSHSVTVISVPTEVTSGSASPETARPGNQIEVFWDEYDSELYLFTGVTISGEYSNLEYAGDDYYASFTMGNTDVTVYVNFKRLYYVYYMMSMTWLLLR